MPTIDLTADEPVLEYIEGQTAPRGVPARDLNGGDLARLAMVELLTAADHQAEDFQRPEATPADAANVADALVASGAFQFPKAAATKAAKAKAKAEKDAEKDAEPAPPAQPVETTTDPTPAEPAPAPEA